MVYFGHIKNGRVELDAAARLPDGMRVRVEPVTDRDPLDDLGLEAADLGPDDLSVQHDHYTYGTPKKSPDPRDSTRK